MKNSGMIRRALIGPSAMPTVGTRAGGAITPIWQKDHCYGHGD
jgi:hypothetical protein